MNILQSIHEIFNSYLIYCLLPAVLALISIEHFNKGKFPTKSALRFISWIIVVYALFHLMLAIYENVFSSIVYDFMKRALGWYYHVYYFSIFLTAVLPLTFLFKKLRRNSVWLFLVTFFFTMGVYLDRIYITVITWSRDYKEGKSIVEVLSPSLIGYLLSIFQGIAIALLLLGFFTVIGKYEFAKSHKTEFDENV